MGKNRFIVTAYFKGKGKIEIMVQLKYNLHYVFVILLYIKPSLKKVDV